MCIFAVAPLVGAWIEIKSSTRPQRSHFVAPLVGAWIEIGMSVRMHDVTPVAPLVGAWIEIEDSIGNDDLDSRRSSCRSVDCIPNRTGRTFSYVVN